MNDDMPTLMQAARLKLVNKRPYLASAIWALVPRAKPGMGTLAVDKYWRLYFDPALCDPSADGPTWNVDEMCGGLYHEINHLLGSHPDRCETMSAHPEIWNIAADMPNNSDIRTEGMTLPEGLVYPEQFGFPPNLMAEEYYHLLEKSATKLKCPRCNPGAQGQGQQGQGQQGQQPKGGKGKGQNQGQGQGQGQPGGQQPGDPGGIVLVDCSCGEARTGSGTCGSGSGGKQQPFEDAPPAQGGPHGISKGEGELIKQDVAQQINRRSQSRGDVPAGWLRWAKERLAPKVNWKRELQARIRAAVADVSGMVDYTYRRPSRRQSVLREVIMPSLRAPSVEVAVVVDTSGSMGDGQITQAVAEVGGILKAIGCHKGATVLSCDAAVATCKKVFSVGQVTLGGGGGTDMRVGMEAAMKLRPTPQVLIVITDGYSPWSDTPPRAKTIIVRDGQGEVPAWAKVIDIDSVD
jgi:predicted metal-dependent peptidase